MFLLTTLNAYNDRAKHESADIFGVYMIKCGIVYVSINWKSKSLFFFNRYCHFGTIHRKIFYGASVNCIFDKKNKTVIYTAMCYIKGSKAISR